MMKEKVPGSGENILSAERKDEIAAKVESNALRVEGDYFVFELPDGREEKHLATETVGEEDVPIEQFLASRADMLGV